MVFKHADGRRTVVPGHNRPVRTGTLRAILKQADITTDELLKLLKKRKQWKNKESLLLRSKAKHQNTETLDEIKKHFK